MKELCLTIPCEVEGKFSTVQPIHVFIGNDSTGAAMMRWKCPHCGSMTPRRKPMTHHMGLIMNIPAGCPILKAQDEERRKSLRKWLEETREDIAPIKEADSLSDGLFYAREQAKINEQKD